MSDRDIDAQFDAIVARLGRRRPRRRRSRGPSRTSPPAYAALSRPEPDPPAPVDAAPDECRGSADDARRRTDPVARGRAGRARDVAARRPSQPRPSRGGRVRASTTRTTTSSRRRCSCPRARTSATGARSSASSAGRCCCSGWSLARPFYAGWWILGAIAHVLRRLRPARHAPARGTATPSTTTTAPASDRLPRSVRTRPLARRGVARWPADSAVAAPSSSVTDSLARAEASSARSWTAVGSSSRMSTHVGRWSLPATRSASGMSSATCGSACSPGDAKMTSRTLRGPRRRVGRGQSARPGASPRRRPATPGPDSFSLRSPASTTSPPTLTARRMTWAWAARSRASRLRWTLATAIGSRPGAATRASAKPAGPLQEGDPQRGCAGTRRRRPAAT